jgi:hypothetical protein
MLVHKLLYAISSGRAYRNELEGPDAHARGSFSIRATNLM